MTADWNSHGWVRKVNNCLRQTRQALALIAGRNARFRRCTVSYPNGMDRWGGHWRW